MTTITPLKERRIVRNGQSMTLADAITALRQPSHLAKASKEAVDRMTESVARYARLLGDEYRPATTK